VNAKLPSMAFIDMGGQKVEGQKDIQILTTVARNRAIHGDRVVVRIADLPEWELKGLKKQAKKEKKEKKAARKRDKEKKKRGREPPGVVTGTPRGERRERGGSADSISNKGSPPGRQRVQSGELSDLEGGGTLSGSDSNGGRSSGGYSGPDSGYTSGGNTSGGSNLSNENSDSEASSSSEQDVRDEDWWYDSDGNEREEKEAQVVYIGDYSGRNRNFVCTLAPNALRADKRGEAKDKELEGRPMVGENDKFVKAIPVDKRYPWILIYLNDTIKEKLKLPGKLNKFQYWPVTVEKWDETSILPLGKLGIEAIGQAGDVQAEVNLNPLLSETVRNSILNSRLRSSYWIMKICV
jgi:exoribonuclease R